MAAVGVICADTQAEADRLFQSVRLLQYRIRQNDRRPVASPEEAAVELRQYGPAEPERTEFPRYFVGTPEVIAGRLNEMASKLRLSELVINTITHDHAARLRSYSLLAEAIGIGTGAGKARRDSQLRLGESALDELLSVVELFGRDRVRLAGVAARRNLGAHPPEDLGGLFYSRPGDMRVGIASGEQGGRSGQIAGVREIDTEGPDQASGEGDDAGVTSRMGCGRTRSTGRLPARSRR